MFRAVRTPRVYEHIVAQFERAIYEGRLAHGDKLPPERQLVREFGASRVAVRDPVHAAVTHALTALEVKVGAQGVDLTSEDDAAIIAAHLLIHDAIARRDGDAARAAMHAHILDVERRLARGVVTRAAS